MRDKCGRLVLDSVREVLRQGAHDCVYIAWDNPYVVVVL